MQVERIDHVQLAMPAGEEDAAREFYSGLLELPEVPKPEKLSASGGVWFERGELRVHLGVEKEFKPAQKAHPAFRVSSLPTLMEKLHSAGVETLSDDRLPGFNRFFANDPFGNRLEFLEPQS